MKIFIRFMALAICLILAFSAVSCAGRVVGGEETASSGEGSTESNSEKETQNNESSSAPSGTEKETADKNEGTSEKEEENIDIEFDITESDGEAQFIDSNGFSYTATGYKNADEKGFIINQGFEITFDGSVCNDDAFNRIAFKYSSGAPLKVTAIYSFDGSFVSDSFFFNAFESSFRGIIEGYHTGKSAAQLKKLIVSTCEEVDADFVLYGIETETIPLYDDDITVENDRFKIGVRLSWGGSLTYFEDKQDGDDTLGNLVNIHDTGRLIQQSFYGTYSNGEYVSAEYSNSKWPYNPVQGGNKYQSGRPKLIDLEVGEDYIYVLAQSLDWAHDDLLTYTYYENTYTIKDDHVVVDNVATDFSGWEHPAGGQEIPAVYLVSYFDTLSYYNGIKPWTNDDEGICYERELGGWGESITVSLYKGNTETWSIWINSEDNFGFGTYCPNIQKHIAIRHQYDGSKDPMANSTSYVAPSCTIVMKSYEPIVYSYILATGSPEEIREVFKENKDFADNASLSENRYDNLIPYGKFDMENIDFSVEENVDVVHAVKHMSKEYDSAEQAMKLTLEIPSDPQCSIDFDWNSDKVINSDDFNSIEIVYMLPVTNSKASDSFVIFACAGEVTTYNEKYAVNGTVIRDGEYHTLTIKLPDSKCLGDLHKFRLDPFTSGAVGDTIYIKSIRLTTTLEIGIDNDMTVKGSEEMLSSAVYTNAYSDEKENALALAVSGGKDVQVFLDFSSHKLDTNEYYKLVVEYMLPVTNSRNSYNSTIYFTTSESKGYSESKALTGTIIADGEYHTLEIDFSSNENWLGFINVLRFDYFQGKVAEGDTMYIKRIAVVTYPALELYTSESGDIQRYSSKSHTKVDFDDELDAMRFTVAGGVDVNVTMDLSAKQLSCADYSKLIIRYMIPTTNSKTSYSSALYFTTSESGGYSESRSVYTRVEADGEYHTLVIDIAGKSTDWTGLISGLRFDYFQSACENGDVMHIKYIKLQ